MLLIHRYTDISTKKVTKMQKYVAVQRPKYIYVENQEKYMKKMLKFFKNTKQKMKCLDYYWVIIQLKNKNLHILEKP